MFSSWAWGDLIKWECINAFCSECTRHRLFITSPGGAGLFPVNSCSDFIWILHGSSAVVNIMCCGLSSGQMLWFALPLSFTPNRIYLGARKWLRSCHNWSTARLDGSACFCYYLFYLSQNTPLNLHCIPLSHRPLHDQYPHQRLCGDSRILWSMFVELDLLS